MFYYIVNCEFAFWESKGTFLISTERYFKLAIIEGVELLCPSQMSF